MELKVQQDRRAIVFLFSILLFIVMFILLISGLIISIRRSMISFVIFFCIMILLQVYDVFSPATHYINFLLDRDADPPFGMTMGYFVHLLSLIPKSIELIAYLFLIGGLWQLWKNKNAS